MLVDSEGVLPKLPCLLTGAFVKSTTFLVLFGSEVERPRVSASAVSLPVPHGVQVAQPMRSEGLSPGFESKCTL